jgi:DNA-nicking Smr family endonuclease
MAKNENDKDEINLFREAIKGATPLKISPKKKEHKAPQKKPRPVPLNFIRDEKQALIDSISDHYEPLHDIENGDELFYIRQGHSPDVLKKLRKGYWVVQKSIDLHGMISDEAKAYVVQFIAECKKNNIRCIRIVHGKGYNSKNKEPILKNKLKHWLAQKEEVIAYAQARVHDGGSGAVIVLLTAN